MPIIKPEKALEKIRDYLGDVERYETILAAAKQGRGEVQVSIRFNI